MGRRFAGAVLLMGGALFLFRGCGAVVAPPGKTLPPGSGAHVLRAVPFLPQEEDSCGPSSLAMVLRYFGEDARTSEIVRETRTAGLRGTLITDLAAAARRRGFAAEIGTLSLPGLREAIASGVPPILLVDLGRWLFSRPHYLVAYGFTDRGVVAHSGGESGKLIPIAELDRQWERMGRLALVVRRTAR